MASTERLVGAPKNQSVRFSCGTQQLVWSSLSRSPPCGDSPVWRSTRKCKESWTLWSGIRSGSEEDEYGEVVWDHWESDSRAKVFYFSKRVLIWCCLYEGKLAEDPGALYPLINLTVRLCVKRKTKPDLKSSDVTNIVRVTNKQKHKLRARASRTQAQTYARVTNTSTNVRARHEHKHKRAPVTNKQKHKIRVRASRTQARTYARVTMTSINVRARPNTSTNVRPCVTNANKHKRVRASRLQTHARASRIQASKRARATNSTKTNKRIQNANN